MTKDGGLAVLSTQSKEDGTSHVTNEAVLDAYIHAVASSIPGNGGCIVRVTCFPMQYNNVHSHTQHKHSFIIQASAIATAHVPVIHPSSTPTSIRPAHDQPTLCAGYVRG